MTKRIQPISYDRTVITGLDFVAFFERTPDLVCIVSHEGRFLQVNPSVISTLGYSEDELIGRSGLVRMSQRASSINAVVQVISQPGLVPLCCFR